MQLSYPRSHTHNFIKISFDKRHRRQKKGTSSPKMTTKTDYVAPLDNLLKLTAMIYWQRVDIIITQENINFFFIWSPFQYHIGIKGRMAENKTITCKKDKM